MKIRYALPLLLLAGSAAYAEPVKRTRYPSLSPDGKQIAFTYRSDLWTVPAEGGRAERITAHPARDIQPVYTPDGKSIVFASNRFGSYDLFVMPAEGGTPRRLTHHSEAEYPSTITPDGKWVIFYGGAYGSLDLYRMPLAGGEPVRLTWDRLEREYFGSVSPDGQWIVYNHNGAPGSWRRRAYEGAGNADVWIARFTAPVSEPKRVTTHAGHDLLPLFGKDNKTIYYVSDRNGQVNLWSMDTRGGAQKQLTFHETDGVRVPSYAPKADRIAYEFNSEIWLLDLKSGKTRAVPIEAVTDDVRNLNGERTVTSDPTEFTVSPDGKKVALIVRGDLVVVPATGGLARVLVSRPESRESHIAWMPDSKTILFVTDQKGQKDLRSIEISGENEKSLAESGEDETSPKSSPDGKYVAFHRGDKAIVVIPAGGGQPVATIQGDFLDVSRGYGAHFEWSPDNKWLVFEQTGDRMEQAIYVASLTDPQPRRVSRPFRSVGSPHWSPDGTMIYFSGMAVDSSNLYAIDLDEGEAPEFEEDALDQLDMPRQRPDRPSSPEVKIDFDTVERRLRRVTLGANVSDANMAPNSRTFFVQVGSSLFTVPADAKDARGSLLAENAIAPELPRDGSRLFFFSGDQIQSIGVAQRDRRTTSFTATLPVSLTDENRQVFNEAWWLMDRYFYDPKHHGVDWQAIRAKYEALLPHVPYKDDFYDMMAEMVQELRGSHLGTTGPSDYSAPVPSSTAFLGIEPDWAVLDAQGLVKVAHVVKDSPADSKWSKINPGEYILAIDGTPLGQGTTMDELLDRKVGRRVVLTVNASPSMDGARQVAIKPISQSAGDELRYEEWVASRRELAHKLSGGRVGYLHIEQMNVPSEMRFKEEFIGEGTGRDALLVDVRYNGGGNTQHRMLDILRKKPYVRFRSRSLAKDYYADWFGEYLWGKPSALLVNQDSASNSEMMAEGFKALGIGPVVGTPTAGAVIATGSWRFLDGGTIRVPNSGVYSASGENLEEKGRQPDLMVPYDPIASKEGRDPQLEAAVKALLQQLGAK
ncbi:MAG: S41 family peptidase [Armatimonadota bacterium]